MRKKLRVALLLTATMAVSLLTSTKLPADTGTCGAPVTLPLHRYCDGLPLLQYRRGVLLRLDQRDYPHHLQSNRQCATGSDGRVCKPNSGFIASEGEQAGGAAEFWTTTPRYDASLGGLGTTAVGGNATELAASDGVDVWVASTASGTVARVRGSDGKLLETSTGANNAFGVLAAMGRVFVVGAISLTNLYMIDPSQPAGAVSVVAGTAGSGGGIALDGSRIWTANGSPGSVSIITPTAFPPWSVVTLPGFVSPAGILS